LQGLCHKTLNYGSITEEQAARQAGAIVGAFLGVLLLLSVTWCLTLCICMWVPTCPLHDKYYKMAIHAEPTSSNTDQWSADRCAFTPSSCWASNPAECIL